MSFDLHGNINALRKLLIEKIKKFKNDDFQESKFVSRITDFTFKDEISISIIKHTVKNPKKMILCDVSFDFNKHIIYGTPSIANFAVFGDAWHIEKSDNWYPTTLDDIHRQCILNPKIRHLICHDVIVSDKFFYTMQFEIYKDPGNNVVWFKNCFFWTYLDKLIGDDIITHVFVNDGLLKTLDFLEKSGILPNYLYHGSEITRLLNRYLNWDIISMCISYL